MSIFQRSLRLSMVVAMMLIAVVPALVIIVGIVVASNNQARTQSINQLSSLAVTKTDNIELLLSNGEDLLELMLNDQRQLPRMRDVATSLDRRLSPTQQVSSYLQEVQETQSVFDELFLYTRTGEVRSSSTTSLQGEFIVSLPFYRDSIDGVRTHPIFVEPETDKPTVVITLPIFDDDRVVGILAGRVSEAQIVDIMTDYDGLGTTGDNFLVSSTTQQAVTPLRFVNDTLTASTFAIDEVLAGNSGNAQYENSRGETVYGVYRWIETIGAGMVLEIEQGEAVGAFRNFVLLSGGVAILAIIAALGMVWWIQQQLIAPLTQLTTTTSEIAAGNYGEQVHIQSKNEIGVLAASFNLMSREIKNLFDNLEQRVADRTRDLVEARDEAQKANNAKTAFLATTSHELRTPLNAVINYTGLIDQGYWGSVTPEQSSALNTISKSGQHLLNLINDLLDMSKIVSGSLEVYKSEVDLNSEIKDVAEIAQGLLENDNVHLITEIEPDLPPLFGDSVRIRQIMINMVSNACKFTASGHIRLVATKQNDLFLFKVEDTGIGIEPEDYDVVFAEFQQTASGVTKGKGTGLGMSISKNLAEAHSGAVWFESVYGEGTTFYLKLPFNKQTQLN